MTSYLNKIVCLECGHVQQAVDIYTTACESCESLWLDAQYDYDVVKEIWSQSFRKRPYTLWRYSDLLPINEPDLEISMGEGFTPLTRLYQYEHRFNHPHIYIKDERYQPTNSFKDRQAALSVTAMKRNGVKECVLASTGNAAVAYAAYCARAGINLWLFLTSLVPSEKMREIALYGAEVVKVSGTYDETKKIAAEFAKRRGIPMDKGAKTIPAKESMKTLAFEIAEQLALEGDEQWASPDWYVQAVSGGIGPIGAWKGFEELAKMGLIKKMPKLAIIQVDGCSPMSKAFKSGALKATPVIPKTLIHVLATGDPGFSYDILYKAAKSNDGVMLSVDDGEAFAAMRTLASTAGISVEPATAVAFAGLKKMFDEGIIQPSERVVINCSGHTLPAESHILGDEYDRSILKVQLDSKQQSKNEEGLGAALKNLDEQITSILIIDDNPKDRRLIRRLLRTYKEYRFIEAKDGQEGIQLAMERLPDLVICDLSMPEVDGFKVLETLKSEPKTAQIPIVVVSAKNLTDADRKILDAYSESVWQKGGFKTRQLVDHIVDTLGHAPIGVIQSKKTESPIPPEVMPIRVSPERIQSNLIVMIDDNPSDLRLSRKMLQSSGEYGIIEAVSGRDGLEAIYKYHPDLIILDLMMPEVDGFAILETLKGDPKVRDIPVVIITAKPLTVDEQSMLKDDIRTVLNKGSIARSELLDIIRDQLGKDEQ